MATNISGNGLYWESGVRLDKLERDLKLMEGKIRQSVSNVQKEGDKLEGVFNNAAKALGLFFTAQQGSQLVNAIIKVRGEFQQLEIAFGTMLGNKAKADKLMSEMVALAAKTPFGLQDVASGAKQLLAYGFAAEDITKNITMLGNVASGVGSQVGDLIYLYGTLKASGRVTQMDINQFAGRGIPIYAELAKVMGVTVEKVRELVGEGKVGFPQIEKAFQGMTEQGGMFFNLMEAQSKSLTGQISNLQDSIAQMFNEIGQSSEGVLSKGIEGIAYLVENYKEIGNVLTVLITTYGAYRAALILTNAIEIARYQTTLQYGASLTKVTTLKALATQATNLLSAAQTRLAAAFAANPVGLVITAIAGLAATYFVLRDTTTSLERAQKAYNDALKDVKDNTQDLSTKSREFLSIINDGSKTLLEQSNAYRDLKNLYNGRLADLDLESFKLKTVEERQRAVNVALSEYTLEGLRAQKVKALDTIAEHGRIEQTQWENFKETMRDVLTMEDSRAKRLEDAINLEEMLTGEISRQEEQVRLAAMTDAQRLEYAKKQLEPLEMQIKSLETTAGQLERNNDGIIKIGSNLAALSIQHVINQYNQWLGLINSANAAIAGGVANARTVAVIDKEISDLKDLQKGASQNKGSFSFATGKYTKGYADYDKEIKQKESERRKITGEVDKAAVASAKRAATASNKAQRAATQEANREYDRQTALLVNKLNNEKSIYESFEKYRTALGVESANERYKGLIDTSINFETRLANEISKLDAKKDKERLDKLKEMQADAANKKFEAESNRQIEEYNKKLEEEEKHLADLLTKYATYEQQKKALREQYEKDITKLSPAQQAERKRQYDEDVANLDEAEAKKLISVKKYADEAIYTTKLAVRQQLEILNEAYNQAGLSPEAKAALKGRIDEVTKLLSLSDSELTSAQIDAEINKKQAAINELAKAGKQGTDEFKRLNDELMRLKQEKLNYLTDRIDTFRALSSAVGQLGNALSSLGDSSPALASIGNALQSVSSSADLFLTNWEKLANGTLQSADKIQMAATFIVNALNNILQSVQQNKLKEAEALQNVIDFQRGYNLALIEEQKIRDEMANNVFYKDSMRTIRANLSKQISLVKEYDKAMRDLQDGQVKVGTKKEKRDWARVGASTAAGAGTGAIIGASGGVLSIPGAIIGGAVGFIGGMLEKRKVVDVYDNLLKKYPLLIDAEGNLNDAMAKSLLSSNLLDAKTKETLQYVSNLAEEYKKAKAEIDEVVKSLIGDVGNNIMSELVNNFKNGGEDAGEAFRRGFAKSLEKLYEDIIYAAIFGKDLQKMQDRIEKGFETGDMGIMETAMYEFLDGYEQKAEAQQEMMKKLQDYAKSKGIDIWQTDKSTQGSTKSKNSLSGAYAQASQESIDLLSGQTMAFKIAQLETNGHLVQMKDYAFRGLDYAERTANNTANTVARLDTIISKMNNNANNALAAGL